MSTLVKLIISILASFAAGGVGSLLLSNQYQLVREVDPSLGQDRGYTKSGFRYPQGSGVKDSTTPPLVASTRLR